MRAVGLLLAALVLSIHGDAQAQAGGQTAGEAATDPHAEALELFEQSHELYRQGEFAEAAALLERAYGLAPEPVLLYNLGRAREGEGEFSAAIDAYQRYLDTAGEIPDRGAIERKIETLQRTVAERATLGRFEETVDDGATPPQHHDGPPPTPGGPSPVPWIVAAFGAGGIIAGSVIGAVAQSKAAAAEDAPSQEAALREHESAADLALAANVSLAVGGVVLLGGLVWGVIDLLSQGETEVYSSRRRPGLTARVAISPWGAAVEGTF